MNFRHSGVKLMDRCNKAHEMMIAAQNFLAHRENGLQNEKIRCLRAKLQSHISKSNMMDK